ncbi:hypothetical protein PFISCL1PPCAC_11995, partial [Pristionchus fissidentatus]
ALIKISVLLPLATATSKIKCFSCIAAPTGADFAKYCSEEKYCTGAWCTKGPDARCGWYLIFLVNDLFAASGILYGCTDQAPVEIHKSTCKAVNGSRGLYFNCYCNNIEFCNAGSELAS